MYANKAWGQWTEQVICDLLGMAWERDGRNDNWFDARVTDPIQVGEVDVANYLEVPEGAYIEIKTTARRVSSGARGRFAFIRRSHENLLNFDGWYAFCVYDLDTRADFEKGYRGSAPEDRLERVIEDAILTIRFVPAEAVEECFTTWRQTSNGSSEWERTERTWTNFIPTSRV